MPNLNNNNQDDFAYEYNVSMVFISYNVCQRVKKYIKLQKQNLN